MDKWQLVYNILFQGNMSTSARLEAVRTVMDSKAFLEESRPDCVFKAVLPDGHTHNGKGYRIIHANIQHGTKEGNAAGCVCDSCIRWFD